MPQLNIHQNTAVNEKQIRLRSHHVLCTVDLPSLLVQAAYQCNVLGALWGTGRSERRHVPQVTEGVGNVRATSTREETRLYLPAVRITTQY